MRFGEIYLAQFPFGDFPGMKLRPVLTLTGPPGNRGARSVHFVGNPLSLLPSDMLFDPSKPEFATTHLRTPSALRLHKLATIHSASSARHLGTTNPSTQNEVAKKLRDLLGL